MTAEPAVERRDDVEGAARQRTWAAWTATAGALILFLGGIALLFLPETWTTWGAALLVVGGAAIVVGAAWAAVAGRTEGYERSRGRV